MLDFFNFFAFYWDLVAGLRWYWGVWAGRCDELLKMRLTPM